MSDWRDCAGGLGVIGRRWRLRLRWVAVRLWALPCSCIGVFVLVGLGRRFRIRRENGGLLLAVAIVQDLPLLNRRAVTLGHVVIVAEAGDWPAVREHELEHVRQFERWGVLMLLCWWRRPLLEAMAEVVQRCRDRQLSGSDEIALSSPKPTGAPLKPGVPPLKPSE